ncbi:MAG: DeoR/GlpR family DNA-binding transcription regulator [Propionibacteriaceae bacterium]
MTAQVEGAADRHRYIADRLEAKRRVEVCDLAERLGVAPETIRRDLRVLEQRGQLQRVHGGAVRQEERPLSPFDGVTPEHLPAHVGLAEQVIARLPLAGTIVIDSSAISWAVAESLSRRPEAHAGLTVVTTSLDVAVVLSRLDTMNVYNLGGIVEHGSRAQQGDWTLTEVRRFRVDLALLSPAGVTCDGGLFASDPMAAAVLAAQVDAATRVWLLVDANAVGRTALVRAGSIDTVERIFTSGAVEQHLAQPFSDAGIAITAPAAHIP